MKALTWTDIFCMMILGFICGLIFGFIWGFVAAMLIIACKGISEEHK